MAVHPIEDKTMMSKKVEKLEMLKDNLNAVVLKVMRSGGAFDELVEVIDRNDPEKENPKDFLPNILNSNQSE